MKMVLAVLLVAFAILGGATGQHVTLMSVSVDIDGASDAGKKAIEKYVASGFEARGIHKITDNGLDPKEALFDDHGWVRVTSVGDPGAQSYALEIQLSIVQGASVNNMLFRFRGSLVSAVFVKAGATVQEINATLDKLLFSVLDRLMDEAKRDFGSPAYRHGWHPVPVPRGAG
jgi:hypothetical protein